MKNLGAGMSLALLLAAAGLLAGCTQDVWEVTAVGVPLQYENPRVTARKELMRSQGKNARAIQEALKAGKLDDARKAAEDLVKTAGRIPRVFRRNTLMGKTTALPVIWDKKADFDERAKILGTSAAALVVVLKAGDKTGAEMAAKTLSDNCGACHRMFRKPPPPRR